MQINAVPHINLCHCPGAGMSLKRVDYRADVAEDAAQLAKTVYVVVYALAFIPFDEGSSLVVIHIEALLYCLGVVVGTSALLAALDKALHEFGLGHVKLNHCRNLVAAFCEHLLESLGLGNSAGETVEDYALVLLAEIVVDAGKNVNHEFVGDELAVVDVALGCLAELGAVLDFAAQHVAGGDMVEAILLDHEVALCALA